MRKNLSKLGADPQTLSKNHGQVFWISTGEDRLALADRIEPPPSPLVDGQYHTQPGMFSSGQVDPGSQLLGENISCSDGASIADFCAGWGYLSAQVLERCPGVARLHLYEADFASLEAARLNMPLSGNTEVEFFWHDLMQDQVRRRYDLIVMNPPFHEGRRAEPEIGQRLITVAANALASRGRLLLVANRQLPYERIIRENFKNCQILREDSGYKVLSARI